MITRNDLLDAIAKAIRDEQSGRTPDDTESDEDTIWHYYNA